jgi:putative membrane protein
MVRSCLVGIALIATLGAACNRDNPNNNRQSSAPGEGGGLSGGENPSSRAANRNDETRLTPENQQFVQNAAKTNQMEVELAKMAGDKAQSPEIKEYARQLEQDHSEALDELKGIANRASVTLEEPPAAERASMQDKMGSGRAFDRAYIEKMIEDHKKDIAEFERELKSATGELKQYIEKTLPVMREHLQKAEALQQRLAETRS